MKTQYEVETNVKNILDAINEYFDKLTDAMCDGDDSAEREYKNKISRLENKVEILKWVLT